MIKKIKTYILLTLLLLCQNIMAQNKTPTTDSPSQTDLGIFALPPLERAVRCIKYYEGWHDIKRNYPYIGFKCEDIQDGKTQRRMRRKNQLRKRKGRL